MGNECVRQATAAQALSRNEFVAAPANAVFVPNASTGRKTESLAWRIAGRGLPRSHLRRKRTPVCPACVAPS